MNREKIEELDEIKVLLHPAYILNLSHSDYGSFRLMPGRRFVQLEEACRELYQSHRNGTLTRIHTLTNFDKRSND